MPRSLSEGRRSSVLQAATRIIARDGLGASTASIATEAGISVGSLFNYFRTKSDLLNGLYLHLKRDLADAVLEPAIPGGTLQERAREGWSRWTRWGAASPSKQRALMLLDSSDELTDQTRSAGGAAMQGADQLFAQAQSGGPFADQPLEFLVASVAALAAITMEAMSLSPEESQSRSDAGFVAAWSAISGLPPQLDATEEGSAQ